MSGEQTGHGQSTQRIAWLDMLRGFAMVCVVIAHPENVSSDLECLIYSFHMPLFFLISGATFRYNRYSNLKECVIDQAKKLLLPYTVMYIVCTPFYLVNRHLSGADPVKVKTLIGGFLGANSSAVGVMSNGALWFLPALFITAVVYWFLRDLDAKDKVSIVASISGCFMLGVFLVYCTDCDLPWHVNCIPMIVVFYYLGHVAFQYAKNFDRSRVSATKQSCVALALIAVGVQAGMTNGKISVHANNYHDIMLAMISALCISAGVTIVFMNMPTLRILQHIGRHTLFFLGYHIPLMRFFENFAYTENFSSDHPLAMSLLCIVILLPISYLVGRFAPILEGKIPARRRTVNA